MCVVLVLVAVAVGVVVKPQDNSTRPESPAAVHFHTATGCIVIVWPGPIDHLPYSPATPKLHVQTLRFFRLLSSEKVGAQAVSKHACNPQASIRRYFFQRNSFFRQVLLALAPSNDSASRSTD
ncbi:unnamed protein product [Protopolystoma xenopodis]|uniref:Secreted protein n=1 Tax=Protopolystoma xenopodis TaxID=117903 RepID=A0A3S5CJ75_9PLAT|nr:unnamed protein product [Protopolystoma xenopodis]